MKTSFNSRDINMLIINLFIYRIFTQIPMLGILSAKSNAPISALVGGAVWVTVIFVVAGWMARYAKGNILDMAQSVFGSFGKIAVALILGLYLVLSQIFTLGEFSRLINLIAFPASPMWYIAAFLALGGLLGALCDIRAVIRLHGIFVPVILTVFLLLIVSTAFPFDGTDLFAGTDTGIGLPAGSMLSQVVLYGDIFILLLINPTGERKKTMVKKIGYAGALSVVLNTLFVLAFSLKIPPGIAQNGQIPVYLLMKEVYFGRFFQRLDAVILLICSFSAMLYMALNLNLLNIAANQSLRLTKKLPVPLISVILTFCLAVLQQTISSDFISGMIYLLSLGGLAISVIMAVCAKVRRMTDEKN